MASRRNRRRRHFVDIKLPNTTKDTRGQNSGTDTVVRTDVPCRIKSLTGTEREVAKSTFSDATHRVEMLSPGTSLNTKHYLVFGSRTFGIGHIDLVDEVDHELILLCREEV